MGARLFGGFRFSRKATARTALDSNRQGERRTGAHPQVFSPSAPQHQALKPLDPRPQDSVLPPLLLQPGRGTGAAKSVPLIRVDRKYGDALHPVLGACIDGAL
jgi:hypothetical protein